MSGPWSTPKQTPPASSLREVMSEQAAETPEDDELARALAESMKLAEEEKAKEKVDLLILTSSPFADR